jgi:hypothetical protein
MNVDTMPQIKKVLVNGCSFTAESSVKNWPKHLPDNWHIVNLAQHAAGNSYICDSTIIETINHNYDLVLIMWSGLTRIDVPVNKDTWDQFWFFKSKIDSLDIYYGHCAIGDSPDFPMSDIAKPIIKFGGIRESILQSLLSMVKLQAWLDSKNIPYKFMSFMNYWNNFYIENNIEFPSIQNLKLDKVLNGINFDKWIFLDNNKNGIYELTKAQKLYAEDNLHPNSHAGKLWADIIVKKLQNAKN